MGRGRKLAKISWALAALCAGTLGFGSVARATVVERIVAVVGDQPILLTELRHRARPNLLRLVDLVRRDGDLRLDRGTLLELFVHELLDEPFVKL